MILTTTRKKVWTGRRMRKNVKKNVKKTFKNCENTLKKQKKMWLLWTSELFRGIFFYNCYTCSQGLLWCWTNKAKEGYKDNSACRVEHLGSEHIHNIFRFPMRDRDWRRPCCSFRIPYFHFTLGSHWPIRLLWLKRSNLAFIFVIFKTNVMYEYILRCHFFCFDLY